MPFFCHGVFLGSQQSDRGALVLISVTVLIWGMSWIVMKSMAPLIGPFDLVAARYGIAFVVMFALLLVKRQWLRFPPFCFPMGMALFPSTPFQVLAKYAL